MNWQEYIDFADVGGLTDSTYHNVFFRDYTTYKEGDTEYIAPVVDFDFVKVDQPIGRNARDILIELLGLYNKMTTLGEAEIKEAILKWCVSNIHPYNIDKLNSLFQGNTEAIKSEDILSLAYFPLETFKKDLIALGTHFNFFYALDRVHISGSAAEAMDLYKTYNGWSEYSCFEKYKKKALRDANGDENATAKLFKKYVDADNSNLQRMLVNKFHSFKLNLTIDPVTDKIVHHLAIDSIFDIAWFAFSKLVTEDAAYVEFEDQNYFDDFSSDYITNKSFPITRCLACGDYIKRIKNKKYCDKPECQNRRKALKSQKYYLRKKQEKQ